MQLDISFLSQIIHLHISVVAREKHVQQLVDDCLCRVDLWIVLVINIDHK